MKLNKVNKSILIGFLIPSYITVTIGLLGIIGAIIAAIINGVYVAIYGGVEMSKIHDELLEFIVWPLIIGGIAFGISLGASFALGFTVGLGNIIPYIIVLSSQAFITLLVIFVNRERVTQETQESVPDPVEALESSINVETLDKLRDLMAISDRIKLDMLARLLNVKMVELDEIIMDLALRLGFRLDGNCLVVNPDKIGELIEYLRKKQ